MRPRYATLADFLACQMLTIDASTEDGWGAAMPVKGREIAATILFVDVAAFSARTVELDPAETLAFVNHFFAWISAEALHHGPGIVDKYIGDEVMVVFSTEFGSEDPVLDAVHAARAMGRTTSTRSGHTSGSRQVESSSGTLGLPRATARRCSEHQSRWRPDARRWDYPTISTAESPRT
jgi:class 3 adenylate cyclase